MTSGTARPATCMSTRTGRAAPRERYDSYIPLIVGALMVLGVVMVYSASVTVVGGPFDWRDWWDSPLRQGVFAAAGFLALLFGANLGYGAFAWHRPGQSWRSGVLALLAALLLVAVLLPGVGRSALGARRALIVPGLNLGFQPSELAKVALVLWTAALLTRPPRSERKRAAYPLLRERCGHKSGLPPGDIRNFRTGFLPVVLSGGLLIGLTGIEDFGTAALMGVVLFGLLLVGGARWLHMALLVLLGVGAGALLIISAPYRIKRLVSFFTDELDLEGAGYQVHQGMLAIASGGWWGRGLGAGVQKYGYIPYDNNDFILAVICEELGIVGGLAVAGLFLLLVARGWWLASRSDDRFGQLVAVGLTLMLGFQAAFNIGVVTHSVPTKGISLPFVSAGGSGVLFLGFAAGLLASVARTARADAPK